MVEGPGPIYTSGYMQSEPFHPVKGDIITVTGSSNSNGEWVLINDDTYRYSKTGSTHKFLHGFKG